MRKKPKTTRPAVKAKSCPNGEKVILDWADKLLSNLDDYENNQSVEAAHQCRVLTRRIFSALNCCDFLYPQIMLETAKENLSGQSEKPLDQQENLM